MKPVEDFYSQEKVNSKGEKYTYFRPDCKDCTKQSSSKWQRNNQDRYKEIRAKTEAKPRTKELRNKMNKKLRKEGKERLWKQRNKDRLRQYQLNRQHKQHEISLEERESCKGYFNFACAYCGMNEKDHILEFSQRLHMDHVNPDGANDLSNNVPACKSCNSKKGTHSLEEFYSLKEVSNENKLRIEKWLSSDYTMFMEIKI